MSVIHPKEYDAEKVKKEICELIDLNNAIFAYKVERDVTVNEPVTIKITVEMYKDSEAKNIIV